LFYIRYYRKIWLLLRNRSRGDDFEKSAPQANPQNSPYRERLVAIVKRMHLFFCQSVAFLVTAGHNQVIDQQKKNGWLWVRTHNFGHQGYDEH